MIADSPADDGAAELLERSISAYNAGVRTSDFRSFLALLTDDAQFDFEGVPDRGALAGKDAIAQHFADDPPDDQIRIVRWKRRAGEIVAEFTWLDIPESGGCLVLRPSGERIQGLTIVLGGPRRRFA